MIAGKYGEGKFIFYVILDLQFSSKLVIKNLFFILKDYGLVDESCNTYKGVDGICHTNQTCTKYYTTNYRYIGGFYGACNEPLMRIALVKNGPLAVSFQVYDDFMSYKSGIYRHTSIRDEINFKFNPWEVTNHVGKYK